MSFATRFARALVPVVVMAAPVAADAKPNPDMQLVKAHLQVVLRAPLSNQPTHRQRRRFRKPGTSPLPRPP